MTKKSKERKNKSPIHLNDFQIAALAKSFKRDTITIKRWAKKGSDFLRLPNALEIIKQFEQTPEVPEANI